MMTEEEAKSKLLTYFRARVELTEDEEQAICNAYTLHHYKKKAYVFEQGKPSSLEGFIVSGTFRVFYNDLKASEHVLYFAFPNWWIGNMITFHSDQTSSLSAQALEEGYALLINKVDSEELFRKVPKLERVFRIMLQKSFSVLQKRFLLTVSSNAEERYKELLERSPGIEQLVPQHQIASYLGILPESFSRMKKQLLKG